jgi:tRNA A-37 threonylcarbamoyl transferase component Bud32
MSDRVSTDERAVATAAVPGTVRRGRRARRPSGAPPPLPRKIGISGAVWIGLLAAVIGLTVVVVKVQPALRLGDHIDTWWLNLLVHLRTPWLTALMRGIKSAGSGWGITALGLGSVIAIMFFRRWRHLLVFLGSLFLMGQVVTILFEVLARPRPYGVRIIGGWSGFSMPSPPVCVLAAVLVGIAYTLIVPGRPRSLAKWGIGIVLLVFVLARQYLGVEHPSDAGFGLILGVAIPVLMFRFFTPNEIFPISYKRRGNAAHLDVTGPRGEAIRKAVQDQLGLTVLDIKPFGEEGSGGSTPLRLRVQGDPDTYVFAKLYAKSHVRADRWYKLWRTILNGKLEDEASFQSVRRFVEYEDYTLRLLNDSGIPVPEPYGIVEITPEREYMIVMQFYAGAKEIGEADVDDQIIDEGLALIRRLWDAGVAHRDIKPANLMVRDGKVLLIDVFFVQVRPSPWRQAVDLGNRMLVLAVRSDPDRVYEHALRFFSPDEIAEAFAATRGVASPTQLRAFMKRDGRDLLARFRTLAPARRPVALQRWSVRRVALGLGMLIAILISAYGGVTAFLPRENGSMLPVVSSPECGTGHAMILMAQAVPSATSLPCIATLPSGWTFGGAIFNSGQAHFWLDSDQAGMGAAVITLRSSCDVRGALETPSDEVDTRRFEAPASLRPLNNRRTYLFPGGCVTYDYRFPASAPTALGFDVDSAVSFVPRAGLVSFVEREEGLTLCGAGAPCPG